jgi:plasmid stability protein
MPEMTIRDIPQQEYEALEARAARHGRTVDEEARHLLHEAAAEQMLISELQRATQAVDATLKAVAPAPAAGAQQATARRRVRYEPTPRRG